MLGSWRKLFCKGDRGVEIVRLGWDFSFQKIFSKLNLILRTQIFENFRIFIELTLRVLVTTIDALRHFETG